MRVDIPGVAKGEQANQRSVAHVSSIVLFGMLGFLMLTLMPGLVGGLSDIVGATPAQAGLTASCELGGAALGSFIVLMSSHRFYVRSFIRAAILLMTAASFATALTRELGLIALFWAALGLGGGLMSTAAIRAAAALENPGRVFGLVLVGQASSGVVMLLVLRPLLSAIGFHGVFAALALATFTTWALVHFVPDSKGEGDENPFKRLRLPAVLISASILVHYTANGALWAYADRLGVESHVAPSTIDLTLAGSMASGLLGAIVATVWGRWFALSRGIFLGLGLIVLASALFLVKHPGAYSGAVLLMNFAILMTIPLFLAFLAGTSDGQDAAALGNFASAIGLMAGPATGGAIVAAAGYSLMIGAAIGGFLLATVLAAWGVRATPVTENAN